MKGTPFLTLIVLGALLVAAAAAFVVYNRPGGALEEGSFNRVAAAIVRGEDHVQVTDLADWIIKDRGDFMLVDIRPAAEYAEQHIDGAESIPLTQLLTEERLADLPDDRAIVLYGNGTTAAGQGAALLRLVGRDAQSLLGGLNAWNEHMAAPGSVVDADDDVLKVAKRRAVSCFFAGEYDPAAGIPVRQAAAGGFTPPLEPAEPEGAAADADPLGLGLGLGLGAGAGSDTVGSKEPAEAAGAEGDPLGLGLGLGLGTGVGTDAEGSKPKRGLNIGEGC
ncbi:MAG: rhodanese-like domain-containing protein [Chromatiales bacterium]|jgi:rhodanese-related sulfurtransferase